MRQKPPTLFPYISTVWPYCAMHLAAQVAVRVKRRAATCTLKTSNLRFQMQSKESVSGHEHVCTHITLVIEHTNELIMDFLLSRSFICELFFDIAYLL